MPNGKIAINMPEAHEKLTARLFYKRKTEYGYIDAGNVKDYADTTTRSLVTRSRAEDGARFVNDEQPDVTHESYSFTLDERHKEQEILIKTARALSNTVQAQDEGATASITHSRTNRWFAIGAYNIANLTVSGSSRGSLEEGVDYDVDYENGRLFIRGAALSTTQAAQVTADAATDAMDETLSLVFDQPLVEMERIESQNSPLFYCDVILEEYNQYSQMWLRRAAFGAYLNVTEFPSQTGEFGVYKCKVTPDSKVTWRKRGEGQSLNTQRASAEGPDASSSSQSESSAHSSQSSSS